MSAEQRNRYQDGSKENSEHAVYTANIMRHRHVLVVLANDISLARKARCIVDPNQVEVIGPDSSQRIQCDQKALRGRHRRMLRRYHRPVRH